MILLNSKTIKKYLMFTHSRMYTNSSRVMLLLVFARILRIKELSASEIWRFTYEHFVNSDENKLKLVTF